jgi:hypothetical protein
VLIEIVNFVEFLNNFRKITLVKNDFLKPRYLFVIFMMVFRGRVKNMFKWVLIFIFMIILRVMLYVMLFFLLLFMNSMLFKSHFLELFHHFNNFWKYWYLGLFALYSSNWSHEIELLQIWIYGTFTFFFHHIIFFINNIYMKTDITLTDSIKIRSLP